jgi:hypothetical protein
MTLPNDRPGLIQRSMFSLPVRGGRDGMAAPFPRRWLSCEARVNFP